MRTHFGLIATAALVAVLAWSPPVVAQQKTFRQCREEWAANNAAIAASGKTQRVFVAECRGVPLPSVAPVELSQDQYGSEAEARAACANDPIVWVNLRSKVYHRVRQQELRGDKGGRVYVPEGYDGSRLSRSQSRSRSRRPSRQAGLGLNAG